MSDLVIEPSVNLLESMRSVGYSTEAAIADIVDNSIDADATQVEIDIDVVAGSYIAILDNGNGMQREEAIEALRLAGTANSHGSDKLGRFGLGLKTASLSQGRRLTVLTKQDSVITCLRWDIDHVIATKSWRLIELDSTDSERLPLSKDLADLQSGTLIVLEKLDALLGDSDKPGLHLTEKIRSISDHLALTFNRFLLRKRNRLKIIINGVSVQGVDPFLSEHGQTQSSPVESMKIGNETVTFRSYTLPHPSGLSLELKNRYDLAEGMREAQGFYIFRNDRLISKGHWFGLARMNEITKQTRVEVDIPRELDGLWQLDIKKSRTEPPASFKNALRKMINPLLDKSKRLHTFRGRKESNDQINHLWNKVKLHDGFKYEINLENPVIRAALSTLDTRQAEQIEQVFSIIAAGFPHLDAYQEMAGNAEPTNEEQTESELLSKLQSIKNAGVFDGTIAHIKEQLMMTEPFSAVENLSDLVDEVWGANNAAE